MNDPRLNEAELKLMDLEHALDQLNDVVIRQQAQIDRLTRELQALALRQPSGDSTGFRSLRDELPPHY